MELCTICGKPIDIGDYPCVTTPRPHQRGINGAIGDECDIVQENGFRHPTRFTSKRELTRALAANGHEIMVRHKTIPGTDKSPYTTDWSKGSIDAQTLENARVLAERQAQSRATVDANSSALNVTWTIRELPK